LDPHLSDFHFAQVSASQFTLDAHAWHNRHALFHFNKTLDTFDRRQFHFHTQRSFVFCEHLLYALPIRRFDDMRDKNFLAKNRNIYLPPFRQAVPGPHYQH